MHRPYTGRESRMSKRRDELRVESRRTSRPIIKTVAAASSRYLSRRICRNDSAISIGPVSFCETTYWVLLGDSIMSPFLRVCYHRSYGFVLSPTSPGTEDFPKDLFLLVDHANGPCEPPFPVRSEIRDQTATLSSMQLPTMILKLRSLDFAFNPSDRQRPCLSFMLSSPRTSPTMKPSPISPTIPDDDQDTTRLFLFMQLHFQQ